REVQEMKYKILIVDDNADTREMLSLLLELEHFKVVTAEDGEVGLRVAEAERPDLVITDINMPRVSGIEMIQRLRKQNRFQQIPIVTITAHGSRVRSEAKAAGADLTLPKPVEIDSLVDDIRMLLGIERTELASAC
ncbi:MAG TPA: response regulator, partial [Blastocatellia bacterium]|nr:response regulator [Blastocatellia bacterium]